jgi:hypothetical protein
MDELDSATTSFALAARTIKEIIACPMANDNLPEVLKGVRTRPLLVMRLKVQPYQLIGATPGVNRRIGVVPEARLRASGIGQCAGGWQRLADDMYRRCDDARCTIGAENGG